MLQCLLIDESLTIQKAIRVALSDYDVEKLKAGRETLMKSAQNLFAKLYEQNGPGANAGTGTGTPDFGNDDDNVVDGDFKEV